MNKTELELLAGYRRRDVALIMGEKTRHVVTLNPNSAKPGEILPGSRHLLFDFVVSNTKTTFLNNLSSLLQNRFEIKLAGTTVYYCSNDQVVEHI